jgi:hypothetical protein
LSQEFRTLATLRHPNIISVGDYGLDADRNPYFTMDLLVGAQPLLPFAASAPAAVQMDLLVQLLQALAYLHRRGVVHGDLKPNNILLVTQNDGSTALYVVDFGLAASIEETRSSRAAGTVPYMAPELFCGSDAREASDIFAVGVMACEMFAGHHPFRRKAVGLAELVTQILTDEPDLDGLPPTLEAVVAQSLSKAPSDRPATANAFLEQLSTAMGIPVASDPAFARESYLMAARFTGREKELGVLRSALEAARANRGSAWLVGGESGVGKSRLLEELRSYTLVEGVLVVRGEARSSGGTAYHVWHDALEVLALHVDLSEHETSVLGAVLPNSSALLERDVAALPDVDVQLARSRLIQVLRDVVKRSRDPVLVLLEDLHWADVESLELLAQVSAELSSLPLLIVASYRDDEALTLPHRLPAMQSLRLGRFDQAGIERLCLSILGPEGQDAALIERVTRETEGNTYFIVEVLRALAEESGGLSEIGRRALPERILAGGVEQVLARRLSRVPAEARPLLDMAAVAGRYLDLAVLSRNAPHIDALVQACAEAGVLEVYEQRWRFGHDKLRERVLGELDKTKLRGLHERVAESLEASYPKSAAHAAQIAYHYRDAGRPVPAAHYFTVAGDAAIARGAPGEAEVVLEQARALHTQITPPLLDEIRVWRGLTQARFALGQLAGTDEALRTLCATAGKPLPTDGPSLGWAIGRQLVQLIARNTGVARHAPIDPRRDKNATVHAELLLGLSVQEVYVWLVRPEMVVLCTLWGLNIEQALVGPWDRTDFRSSFAFLLAYTPLRSFAMGYIKRDERNVATGTHIEISHLRIQAILLLNEGRWADAALSAKEAITAARARKEDQSLLECLLHLQLAQTGLDDYRAVLETCREIEQLAARMQNPRYAILALIGQSISLLRFGEMKQAEAILDRARASLPLELGPIVESTLWGLASVCELYQGHLSGAEALAARTMDIVRSTRFTVMELRHPLCCIVDAYLSADDHSRYVQPLQEALAKLRQIAKQFPAAESSAFVFQGRFEWLEGRPAQAAAFFRRSLHAAQRLHARYDHALARYWLGRLAASKEGRRHVPEGPLVHLRVSLSIFTDLGFVWDAARVRAVIEGLTAIS